MSVIELVSAILLILSCVFIIVLVLMQGSARGMSQAITGGSADNFYQKNSGRTKEARLAKATRTAAIFLFVITIAVNVAAIYFSGDESLVDDENTSAGDERETEEDADETDAADATEAAETTAAGETEAAETTAAGETEAAETTAAGETETAETTAADETEAAETTAAAE